MIGNAHGRAIRWMACTMILALATWGWCEAEAGKSQPSQQPGERGATAEPSAIDLRPNFVAGRNATYEYWQQADIQQNFTIGTQQREMTMTLETNGRMYWEVLSVRPDGSARCGLTIQWLTLRATSSDEPPVEVDTRRAAPSHPMGKRMHETLSAFHNQRVEVDLSAQGTVTALHGMDSLQRRLEAAGGEKAPKLLDYEFLAETLACLPAAPAEARRDTSWRHELSETSALGERREDTTYRLVGVESIAGIPVATVHSQAEVAITFDKDDGSLDLRSGGGSATMQVMYDLQRNEVVGSHRVVTANVTASSSEADGPQFSSRLRVEAQTQFLRIAEEDPS